MEVIAKKSKSVFFAYLLMFIIGIVLLIMEICYVLVEGFDFDPYSSWLIVLPFVLIGIGAYSMANHLKFFLTFNLISLKDDTLIIGRNKYIIKISELQNVKAEKEFGKTGKITLITNTQTIKLVSVAQYEIVYNRLLELKSTGNELSKSI